MNADLTRPDSDGGDFVPRRLFLHEPGWRIARKVGSTREFCYVMAPGQDYYHRLYDGEIYLQHGDERLCLACAERRGLIAYEPRGLRESLGSVEFDVEMSAAAIELMPNEDIGVDWPS
jgi:hypothetical protein